MTDRWRGRAIGLAVATALACLGGLAAVHASARDSPALVVRDADGRVLARVAIPEGEFTLRYRNSLYDSVAEERFVVTDAAHLRLVKLAADELAVLEEYYVIGEPAKRTPGGDRAWTAVPALRVEVPNLQIAATDRGERTLLVHGHPPVELWRLVDDADPSVLLELDS